MATKLLAAWTPCEDRPAYINFSEDAERGVVRVIGREKAGPDEVYGRGFMLEIPKKDFAELLLIMGAPCPA